MLFVMDMDALREYKRSFHKYRVPLVFTQKGMALEFALFCSQHDPAFVKVWTKGWISEEERVYFKSESHTFKTKLGLLEYISIIL